MTTVSGSDRQVPIGSLNQLQLQQQPNPHSLTGLMNQEDSPTHQNWSTSNQPANNQQYPIGETKFLNEWMSGLDNDAHSSASSPSEVMYTPPTDVMHPPQQARSATHPQSSYSHYPTETTYFMNQPSRTPSQPYHGTGSHASSPVSAMFYPYTPITPSTPVPSQRRPGQGGSSRPLTPSTMQQAGSFTQYTASPTTFERPDLRHRSVSSAGMTPLSAISAARRGGGSPTSTIAPYDKNRRARSSSLLSASAPASLKSEEELSAEELAAMKSEDLNNKRARAATEHRRRVELKESFEKLRLVLGIPQPRVGKRDMVEQAVVTLESYRERERDLLKRLADAQRELQEFRNRPAQWALQTPPGSMIAEEYRRSPQSDERLRQGKSEGHNGWLADPMNDEGVPRHSQSPMR